MSEDDHDPAFPSYSEKNEGHDVIIKTYYHGMSLRDWFAGMALQGYLSLLSCPEMKIPEPRKLAETAYDYAEAMIIEARKNVR